MSMTRRLWRPRAAQEAQRRAQESPKEAQEPPAGHPRRGQERPRRPKMAPKRTVTYESREDETPANKKTRKKSPEETGGDRQEGTRRQDTKRQEARQLGRRARWSPQHSDQQAVKRSFASIVPEATLLVPKLRLVHLMHGSTLVYTKNRHG